jgi:hypothetical protein
MLPSSGRLLLHAWRHSKSLAGDQSESLTSIEVPYIAVPLLIYLFVLLILLRVFLLQL